MKDGDLGCLPSYFQKLEAESLSFLCSVLDVDDCWE
jgi:hypothetical protein